MAKRVPGFVLHTEQKGLLGGKFLDLIGNPWVIAGVVATAIAIPVAINNASNEPMQAGFSASPLSGTAPLIVQFTDESTGDFNYCEWDFDNDGTVDSTEHNLTYTYLNPGVYTVSLTVSDMGWSTETKTDYINVLIPLQAEFSASPLSGTAPLIVQFTDESTGDFSYWEWDFDNDGTVDSTEHNPTYTYISPGVYTVSLTVGNGTLSTETKTEYVTVLTPPQAGFNANPVYGTAPLIVQFTDESTGDVSYWEWDFDNDGTVDNTEHNPTYTYISPGVYTVSLTVGNGTSNTETKTEYVTVLIPPPAPLPPQPQAGFSASPLSGTAPLIVQFADESTGDVSYREWDFDNDGTVDSTEHDPTYTYLNPGVYTVSLTVGNGTSSAETKTEYVTVLTPPQAEFSASPLSGTAPLIVQFTDESTGDFSYWEWDFDNDGTVDSTEHNPTYTYISPGVYTVSLTVGNGTLSTETKTHYIIVSIPPSNGEEPEEEG